MITKRRKRVARGELSTLRMVAGNEHRFDLVVLDGRVKRWVGIGWVDEGPATEAQARSLPVVE